MSTLNKPLRLRSWHQPIVEDTEGRTVASCGTIEQVREIARIVNVHDELVAALTDVLPAAASALSGTPQGAAALERARKVLEQATAALVS